MRNLKPVTPSKGSRPIPPAPTMRQASRLFDIAPLLDVSLDDTVEEDAAALYWRADVWLDLELNNGKGGA